MTRRSEILNDPPADLELILHAISNRKCRQGEFRALVDAVKDWNTLLALAARHHVSPMLYLGLKQGAWSGVPEPVQARLKAHFAANLKRNFRLAQHATALLKAFASTGVPVIPFKGVFIAASVYGHLSSREVSDIDLLIDPQDEHRAREILMAANFEPVEILNQQQVFRQRTLQIEIDLHWQVSPDFFPVNYDFQRLWQRSVVAQLGAVEYHSPAAEDLLLLLCLQVAKDCWERRQRLTQLQKICDIAAVVEHSSSLNWDELLQQAADQGLTRVLHFSLALAEGLLGARLPAGISNRIATDKKARALARQVSALPALAETCSPPEGNSLLDVRLRLRQLSFYLRLRELQRDKWRYPFHVLRALMAPDRQKPA